ncbi:MAG: hypothetical protein LDL47_06765 [Cyanobacteria bacterium KgW148]|nr:hypothetical protein [Cyanobacteria bacterium KgW148]
MRYWLLLGLFAFPQPIVVAQTHVTHGEVKAFIQQLEQSFNQQDITSYGNNLSEQFKVIVQLIPNDQITFDRRDFLSLVATGFKDNPSLTTKYALTKITNAGSATIVEGSSTETDGKETVRGRWRINLTKQGSQIVITQMELFQ